MTLRFICLLALKEEAAAQEAFAEPLSGSLWIRQRGRSLSRRPVRSQRPRQSGILERLHQQRFEHHEVRRFRGSECRTPYTFSFGEQLHHGRLTARKREPSQAALAEYFAHLFLF